MPFKILHVGLGLWISITKLTTYSAYRTSSHVKMAHTHPQMSLTHHKRGSVISQARPSFLHSGPRSTVLTPSSTGPLCLDLSVFTIGPFGSSSSFCLQQRYQQNNRETMSTHVLYMYCTCTFVYIYNGGNFLKTCTHRTLSTLSKKILWIPKNRTICQQKQGSLDRHTKSCALT